MKRYIISIVMWAVANCAMAQQIVSPDKFLYETQAVGTASVSGCEAQEGIAIIPETVEIGGTTYTITEIGDNAFANTTLAAISLPNTITKIGNGAFEGCMATFIRMSPAVTAIGERAFYNCKAIGHIDLPESLETIGNSALSGSSVYTVGTENLPRLQTLGDYAFSDSRLLETPKMEHISYVGNGAFSGCSFLQTVYLPDDAREISDNMFASCSSLRSISLPEGVTRIGNYAFAGSALESIDLSQYRGKIGVGAFNKCNGIDRLSLPADNPYCRVSGDGKVLYSRDPHELLSVLPTAETLVIEYGVTGTYVTDSVAGQSVSPLDGDFWGLTSLELPCTWTGEIAGYYPALRDFTVRAAQPFPNRVIDPSLYFKSAPPRLHVFPHARKSFENAPNNYDYGAWRTFRQLELYDDLLLPYSKMYLQEVKDMYAEEKTSLQGERLLVWTADWNKELEEQYPDYFPSNQITSGPVSFIQYRSEMVGHYLTSDKMRAYSWQPDSITHCMDGEVRFISGFDVNDFVNWYLSASTIPADQVVDVTYGSIKPMDDAVVPYFCLIPQSVNSSPRVIYALPMLPTFHYNIYVVMAPHNPNLVTVGEEEVEPKNKLRFTLQYNNDPEAKPVTVQSDILDFQYNGEIQEVLAFENVEVQGDCYNQVTLTTSATATDRRNGYSNSLAIIGIVARPVEAIDPLPSDVTGIEEQTPAVSYYDLTGRKYNAPVRGVNILSNGKKLLVP